MRSNPRCPFALMGGILLGACGDAASLQTTPSQDADAPRQVDLAEALRQADIAVSAGPPPQYTITAYITGYSYWDNTPPGSAAIAMPVIHSTAGGQGTYADPITLAVGYSIVDGESKPDVPAGTRFYLERLRKYAIVEDICGHGPTPQNGPCHRGYTGYPWFDVFIGGRDGNALTADACARKITALQPVILNPAPNLPVSAGELAKTAC